MHELGDVVSASGGFFNHISDYTLGIDATILDMLLIERYSTRPLAPYVEKFVDDDGKISSDDLDKLASMLTTKYSDLWDSVKLVNGVNVDFTKPKEYTKTISYSVTKEGSNTNENGENSKVFGFDGTDGSDSSAISSTGTGTSTGKEEGSRTESESGHDEIDIANMLSYIDLHSRKNIVSTYLDTAGALLTVPMWGDD